tara:strand:+ start:1884 stop:2129 length:246 start_codon:yes stop_codon:yes gene_type:complete
MSGIGGSHLGIPLLLENLKEESIIIGLTIFVASKRTFNVHYRRQFAAIYYCSLILKQIQNRNRAHYDLTRLSVFNVVMIII